MSTEQKQLTGYPSKDKPWLKYYSKEILERKLPKCTVYQNIFNNNRDHLNDIAIQYYGNRITYGTLFSNVHKCAKALRAVGVKKGDFVTLCSAGAPEAIYIVLACSKIGAIANFINPLFTREQMIERINETETEWMFVLDEMFSYVADVVNDICAKKVVIIPVHESFPVGLKCLAKFREKVGRILKIDRNKYVSWKDFLKYGNRYEGKVAGKYEKDLPVVMVYSSGTTGASKGILLTNDGINATTYNKNIPSEPIKRQDSFLQMIPIWFSTGIVISVIIPLVYGVIVIPELRFSKESFVEKMIQYNPTMTLAATSLWIYAVSSKKWRNIDFSTMKYSIVGGEKLLYQDEQRINKFMKNHGCKRNIYKGYGMCELGGTVTSSSDAINYIEKADGTGYPLYGVSVSAFDMETGEELPYGSHGEIRVSSPARMKGYFKNPEATAEFFKTDDKGNVWGCTGDIGYVDEDGEVFILGRATDSTMTKDGRKIYLFDIENVILKESKLAACKVVDIGDDSNVLVAHIVLRDGIDESVRDIIKRIHTRCKKELEDFQIPVGYKVRDSLPVHSNGKRDVEALQKEKSGYVDMNGKRLVV